MLNFDSELMKLLDLTIFSEKQILISLANEISQYYHSSKVIYLPAVIKLGP